MKRLKQFESLHLETYEATEYPYPMHSHTYYEIIYIEFGSGVHHLNTELRDYHTGDLFLLSPSDQHMFHIKESTKFIFIKFTDSYFSTDKNMGDAVLGCVDPIAIMKNTFIKEKGIHFGDDCKKILKNCVENIMLYSCWTDTSTSLIIYHQILTLLAMVNEAIRKMQGVILTDSSDKSGLISYIHKNIYEPQLLKIETIAAEFHISENYFSAYFKRMVGSSYRDYINMYRANLIEKRIVYGDFSLKQIAEEFGFTDESHLTRFFKSFYKVSPKAYKMQKAIAI